MNVAPKPSRLENHVALMPRLQKLAGLHSSRTESRPYYTRASDTLLIILIEVSGDLEEQGPLCRQNGSGLKDHYPGQQCMKA